MLFNLFARNHQHNCPAHGATISNLKGHLKLSNCALIARHNVDTSRTVNTSSRAIIETRFCMYMANKEERIYYHHK